jgi:D-alanyl-D-alanine carboxypeptidase
MARARSQAAIHAVVWSLIAILTVLAATPADARRHYTRRGHASESKHSSYSPPYSAIVVDANSGATLHESSPDSQRHPASLTKIMTLYLLFEQLDIGKISLESKIEVSEHCASRAPSKLDIPAGGTIKVEDAIKALVTKSANDVACAIGEGIGGDEEAFARMMTKKAHAIGMTRTIYRNASGLPNDEQVTTARDQATLGRAIQDRFPRYYRYFATQSFTYRGRAIRNHNHLLGSVEGVDGIKTGFVQASGFNLVTSVRRDGRHLVAVVMGGRTAGARDSRMRELIAQYVSKGSQHRSAPMVAEGSASQRGASKPAAVADVSMAKSAAAPFVAAAIPPSTKAATAQAAARPQQAEPQSRSEATVAMVSPQVGSSEDIRPIPVKTLKVRATTLKSSAIGSPNAASEAVAAAAAAAAAAPPPSTVEAPAAPPAPQPSAEAPPAVTPVSEVTVTRTTKTGPAAPPVAAERVASAEPIAAPAARVPPAPAPIISTDVVENSAPAASAEAAPPPSAHEGWVIQVGALESVTAAKERLGSARSSAANILRRADPFTEKVTKGDKTLYRARFAGLDKDQAEAACRALKRSDIPCILVAGTR